MILQTLFDGLAFARFLCALGFDVLEERGELGQRIVGADVAFEPALVIDQLARDFEFLFADAIQRFDLARVHDGRIQTCFHRIVQEYRVEDHTRSRIETEGNVRDP